MTEELTAEQIKARGPNHPGWKGGRTVMRDGYVMVYLDPDDPLIEMGYQRTQATRYALEHRLVMARHLGRALLPGESVHHINGDKQDNRIENLQLRQGKHGSGIVLRCADCGSSNLEAVELD